MRCTCSTFTLNKNWAANQDRNSCPCHISAPAGQRTISPTQVGTGNGKAKTKAREHKPVDSPVNGILKIPKQCLGKLADQRGSFWSEMGGTNEIDPSSTNVNRPAANSRS